MKYKQTLATSILFMVRFMSVTVNMTISIVMTMLLVMMTVGMISMIAMSISSVVSAMISASIPQAVAIPGLTFVMVMHWLMMVDRVVVVDDGFMMMMIGLRIVCLVFLKMAVPLAKEKITKKTQEPGI